jgi:phosphatidylinositol N-acetylglucosaminyltransferase subunit C
MSAKQENYSWRRILYEKQPYRDNHFDPSKFFEQLVIVSFADYQKYSIFDAMGNVSLLIQQFSAVAFFLAIYRFIVLGKFFLEWLWILDGLAIVIGIVFYFLFNQHFSKKSFFEFVQISILFIICLRIASPVVKTLTSAVSEDTIYATSMLLSVIHLIFHNYHDSSKHQERMADTISLNTALFTAILLASRLQTAEMVVGFVVFAVISFNLFPMVCHLLHHRAPIIQHTLTVFQWLLTSIVIFMLDLTWFAIYEILIAFLWFIGPFLFLKMLKWKRVYKGPWDVAEIKT